MFISNKVKRRLAIFELILAILIVICALGLAFSDTLRDATDKKYTFEKYEKITSDKSDKYIIYVCEENKPLYISTPISNRYLDKEGLRKLQQNDIITCKVIDGDDRYGYEIVELFANGNELLPLEGSKTVIKMNSTIGVVLASVVSVLSIAISIWLLYQTKHGYSDKSKNAAKQNMKKLLLQNVGLSEREKDLVCRAIDSIDTSDTLPCAKEELLKIFENSFFTKGNREYTHASQHLTNQGCHKVFREALQSILADGELKVCYDAETADDSALYVLYKTNRKIIDGYIIKNDITGKFEIEELNMSSDLFETVKLSKKEKQQFVEQLEEYNRIKEDIFDIDKSL